MSTTEGFSDPQPETNAVTEYAVRVYNKVFDTTWLQNHSEDHDRAVDAAEWFDDYDHMTATVVTREVTATPWIEVAR